MPERVRVAYWNNIPSPYFTERLTALQADGRFDVHGIFNTERNPDRSWDVAPEEWLFEGHWAQQRAGGLYDATPVVRSLKPDLLVTLYGEVSFALNAPRAGRHSRRWAIRVVPTYSAWERRHPAKEVVKRALGGLVDGAKVPGTDGRRYAEALGVPAQRVFEVQQSVPVEHFRGGGDRQEARERLGIPADEFVFVYVGRLWEGKGLDVVLDAARRLPHGGWSILLVGDGPMEAELAGTSDLPIRMTGFVQRQELPRVLAAADCLVFPTKGDPFGLVVEESMAAGMPVITSDQMGDAVSRVEGTGAGLVVREHSPAAWAEAMASIQEPSVWARLAEGATLAAEGVGHAAYVRDFATFAEGLLELPPRRRLLRDRRPTRI